MTNHEQVMIELHVEKQNLGYTRKQLGEIYLECNVRRVFDVSVVEEKVELESLARRQEARIRSLEEASSNVIVQCSHAGTPLDAFRWFCGAITREVVDDCGAELRRDARAMRKGNRSRGFIARVIWFRSLKCMLEITLDGCNGIMKRALPFLRSLGL